MTWLTKGKIWVSVMELVMCLTWSITIIFMALCCIICTSLCLHKKCRSWGSACTCVKETISRGMSTWIFCDLYIVNWSWTLISTEAGEEHPLEYMLKKKSLSRLSAGSVQGSWAARSETEHAMLSQSVTMQQTQAQSGPTYSKVWANFRTPA